MTRFLRMGVKCYVVTENGSSQAHLKVKLLLTIEFMFHSVTPQNEHQIAVFVKVSEVKLVKIAKSIAFLCSDVCPELIVEFWGCFGI